MKKVLFFFIMLLLVACGSDESTILPEYNLVSTERPRISTGGYISPAENLIYNIEINYPYEKDSLGLLQAYFINKGKENFPNINKVIVRAYLKGTASPGLPPYASMVLVGDNRDIEINKDGKK